MALAREVKVGAFVSAGLLVAGLVVFMIGDERRAFARKATYYSTFQDVQGLTRGAPVRMGGVDVGQVADVSYGENPSDSRLRVTMSIVKAETVRIREDSVATIDNKGLLGDKMVTITVGSVDQPQLPPASTVKSAPGADLSAITGRLADISKKAETIMGNLEVTTQTLADPEFRDNIRGTVKSLSHILQSVDEGDGYVSRLLKDPAEAKRVSLVVSNLDQATAELDRTFAEVNQTVARVNSGPGLVHDVIYEKGPAEAITQIGRAAGELATTLEGVRQGNGLAHSVVYGDDQTQQLIGDLDTIAKDAKEIVEGVRAGKGTIGALMVDPSVYEDVKLLLGNVERNKALRALVRYSIEKDEKVPPVQVRDPGVTGPEDEAKAPAGSGNQVGAAGRVGSVGGGVSEAP